MKFKILYISLLFGLLFTSCEDKLERPLKFGVSVEPGANIVFEDTIITAPKGTNVVFKFTGDPDFISVNMERFNPTRSRLNFSTQPAWGTHIENTLQVYLYESTDSLLVRKFKTDSATVVNCQWQNITSLCNLPTTANATSKSSVSLDEYRGKKVIIAFRYKTVYANDWQPLWLINNLQINDTVIATGIGVFTTVAATMGFTPFDILNPTAPYQSADLPGVWNLSSTTSIKIKQTPKDNPLNDDWLISKPVEIIRGTTTKLNPIPIKNISTNIQSYAYQFNEVGEYLLTFKATNANYLNKESTEKTIRINITE